MTRLAVLRWIFLAALWGVIALLGVLSARDRHTS